MRRFAVPLAVSPWSAWPRRLHAAPIPHRAAATAVTAPLAATGISGWTETDASLEGTLGAGEGVATVDPPDGSPYILYRGISSDPGRPGRRGLDARR